MTQELPISQKQALSWKLNLIAENFIQEVMQFQRKY